MICMINSVFSAFTLLGEKKVLLQQTYLWDLCWYHFVAPRANGKATWYSLHRPQLARDLLLVSNCTRDFHQKARDHLFYWIHLSGPRTGHLLNFSCRRPRVGALKTFHWPCSWSGPQSCLLLRPLVWVLTSQGMADGPFPCWRYHLYTHDTALCYKRAQCLLSWTQQHH